MTDKMDLVKNAIADGQYPSRLCKYYRLNDNLIKTIENHYLWFDSFASYNDPYEGLCRLQDNYSEGDIRKWFQQLGCPLAPNATISESDQKLFADTVKQKITEMSSKVRVCCFTPHWDNLLMWAHYADSYRGVCLVFDTVELAQTMPLLMRVKYDDNFSVTNYLSNPSETITQMVLTKPKTWEYEQEFRFVTPQNGRQEMPFNISALKEVIIGCKCDKDSENYKKLLSLVSPVIVKESVIDTEDYRVVLK